MLPLVVGEEFRPSVWVFRALLPLLFTRMLSSILGPHIVARGWFWQASAVGLALSLGNLLANWVWIPVYGIAGAVLASVAAYGALSLCASIGFWWAIERAATAVDRLEEQKGD